MKPHRMTDSQQPADLFLSLKEFFQADDWKFEINEERKVLLMHFRGESGRWRVIAQSREEARQLIVYSVLEDFAPTAKFAAVVEFITRANYGIYVGNFELDYDDGEIRFRTSIDVENSESSLNFELLKNLVYSNVFQMNRYYSGFMAVLHAGVDPKTAVDKCEE
jgi:hypothetical protein